MWLPLLAARGPITSLTVLCSTATFSFGVFFVSLRNTAIDCASGSATGAACGVDILEDVVTGIVGVGATIGATVVGFASPTPRSEKSPIFRIDGVDVDWYDHVNDQRHGLNRTIDDPAVIEWQHNHTSPVVTYLTYQKDGYLVKRQDSGIDIPDPSGKRALCRAYYDTRFWGDDLRNYEFRSTPNIADWHATAADLFGIMVDGPWKAGCFQFKAPTPKGTYGTTFELGASCSQDEPANLNCGAAKYSLTLNSFNF